SDPARAAGAARRSRKPFGQRTGAAVLDVAARDHEASRCAVGRRPDRARKDRPHGRMPADRPADGAGDGVAQSLPALLVRRARPTCRLCGGRPMAAQSSPINSRARDAEPAERPSLTLQRRFNAAPEKVYAAWADPQKLVQWFGPESVEEGSVKADIDLRVGGRYRISFNAKGTYNEVGGVYREVVPNQRLVFSWAWHSTPERESLVTISMKPEGSGTLLTFLHEPFADATASDH